MSDSSEDKRKHLELIQGVINRMTSNSSSLKGWAVTLVAALFALSSQDADQRYAYIALLPAFAFWMLDAYYLQQEKLFRDLYNDVRQKPGTDYSMDTSGFARESLNEAAARPALAAFYIPLLLAVIGVLVFINLKKGA
ncbi:hypothetical protein [Pyxidicoccus trucidator]|uniref:hypothetical protein n=1 Tax=Pyxidicoccus trucidator TaxID=2709662 RepID=UPI0013DC758C|nr:hypothetical protein [Pyxidicoccus trucidator]